MQVMFKNQHSASLHSVYKYFLLFTEQFNLFFFLTFPGQNPNQKEKPIIKQESPRQMMASSFIFIRLSSPRLFAPACLLVLACCLPCFTQVGPILADCRTTQSSRLRWHGKQKASRKITLILPGPSTRPSDPLQRSHAVSSMLPLIFGRCVSNSMSQTDANHVFIFHLSSPCECEPFITNSILCAYRAVGSKVKTGRLHHWW